MRCRPFKRPATRSSTKSEKQSELPFDSYLLFQIWYPTPRFQRLPAEVSDHRADGSDAAENLPLVIIASVSAVWQYAKLTASVASTACNALTMLAD